jgi:hypothetical protein
VFLTVIGSKPPAQVTINRVHNYSFSMDPRTVSQRHGNQGQPTRTQDSGGQRTEFRRSSDRRMGSDNPGSIEWKPNRRWPTSQPLQTLCRAALGASPRTPAASCLQQPRHPLAMLRRTHWQRRRRSRTIRGTNRRDFLRSSRSSTQFHPAIICARCYSCPISASRLAPGCWA